MRAFVDKTSLSGVNPILAKYKKNFKSSLVVFYQDGTKCNYAASIRIAGDIKDHISIKKKQYLKCKLQGK